MRTRPRRLSLRQRKKLRKPERGESENEERRGARSFAPLVFMKAMKDRIAITGGIAEGKSTVVGYLRALGEPVASADEAAREALSDPAVRQAACQAVGVTEWDSSRVRAIIAANPERRRALNAVTHPAIWRILESTPARFVEVPLLFEACLQRDFREVWVVACGVEEQRKRLAQRLNSLEEADALIATQLSGRTKAALADRIIRTNQDEPNVMRYVAEALKEIQGLR